jgi:hypothetical protein
MPTAGSQGMGGNLAHRGDQIHATSGKNATLRLGSAIRPNAITKSSVAKTHYSLPLVVVVFVSLPEPAITTRNMVTNTAPVAAGVAKPVP